jgi:CheY-like chemotaxis protein
VLIVDVAMPVEDGLSLMRRVRHDAAGARLPAIAFSASADAQSMDSARDAGFSAFLPKPARPEALLGLIVRLIHAPDQTAPTCVGPS